MLNCTLRLELVALSKSSPEPDPLDASTGHVELTRKLELPFTPYLGLLLQLSQEHSSPEHATRFDQAVRLSGLRVGGAIRIRSVEYDLGAGCFHLTAVQFQAHPSHLRNSLEQWVTGYGFEETSDFYGVAVYQAAGAGDLLRLGQLFERYGDRISVQGETGALALRAAARRNHPEMIVYLVNRGAPLIEENPRDTTPLIEAAGAGHLDLVRWLIAMGARVDVKTGEQSTALTVAAFRGQAEAVALLLKFGADPNLRTRVGDTPLIRAVKLGHTEVMRLLLAAGADPFLANNDGETPLDVARRRGHLEIVALLERISRSPE